MQPESPAPAGSGTIASSGEQGTGSGRTRRLWREAEAGSASGKTCLRGRATERIDGGFVCRQGCNHDKANGVGTVVRGASFRNAGEIETLAGCDRPTIAPALLKELDAAKGVVERKLSPERDTKAAPVAMDGQRFRWALNEDAMATEKLAEGIRSFAGDLAALRTLVRQRIDGRVIATAA